MLVFLVLFSKKLPKTRFSQYSANWAAINCGKSPFTLWPIYLRANISFFEGEILPPAAPCHPPESGNSQLFFFGGGNEVMLTYLIFDAGHMAHLRTDPLAAGKSEEGQPRKRPPPREKREERKLKRIPHNLT